MIPQPVIIGNATLYCGDCLEILPTLQDETIDIEIDPDYFKIACARIEKAQQQTRMEFDDHR